MDNFTGQTIDHRYHILERKDEGGMAVVFKAYDIRLECDVAIKLIRKEAFPADSFEGVLKRFHREARTLAQLNNHPNIIQIIDYNEYEGLPYIVMPFIQGGTLKDILEQRIFSAGEAAKFILPIAKALVYAHSRDKIHRDIKPSNILVTENGDVLLTDFGIAQIIEEANHLSRLTKTGIAIGTPEYMAPEQWLGKPEKASDQYGLGVVFYQMITGRVPYEAETVPAVMLKQATEPLPRPSSFVSTIPYEAEKIIFRALAKDPKDRYPSMAEFTRDLEWLISLFPDTITVAATIQSHVDEESVPVMPTVRRKTSEVILPIDEVPGLVAETVIEEKLPNIPDEINKTVYEKLRVPTWVWVFGIFLLLGIMGLGFWRMNLLPSTGVSIQPTTTTVLPSITFTPVPTKIVTIEGAIPTNELFPTHQVNNNKMVSTSTANFATDTSVIVDLNTTYKISVEANKIWSNTGILINQGNLVEIKVMSGKWKSALNYPWTDGTGYVSFQQFCSDCLLTTAYEGALIAKIIGGEVFYAAPAIVKSKSTGYLYLSFNDCPNPVCFNDNLGFVEVQVVVSSNE